MSLIDILGPKSAPKTTVAAQLEEIQSAAMDVFHTAQNAGAGSLMTEDAKAMLATPTRNLLDAVSTVANRLFVESGAVEAPQIQARVRAATVAGLIASRSREFYTEAAKAQAPKEGGNLTVVHAVVPNAAEKIILATEAFDETATATMQQYSIAYNMNAAFGGEFNETLYPTVVQDPSQAGFDISVNVPLVQDTVTRDLSGALSNFQRRMVLRGYADHTVMSTSKTDLIPVYRNQSAANFVDVAKIAAEDVEVDGKLVKTSFLAFNKRFDLLGITQRDGELNPRDHSDAIEPSIVLQRVALETAGGILNINTSNVATSQFMPVRQQQDRASQLTFFGQVQLNPETKAINGADLTGALAKIKSEKYTVNVTLEVTGSVLLDQGHTKLAFIGAHVDSIFNEDGDKVPLTSEAALVGAIEAAVGLGYKLRAYMTNSNMRERGDIVGSVTFTQSYVTPRRTPITGLRPINAPEDGQDLEAMLQATKVRLANEGVTMLLEHFDALKDVAKHYKRDASNILPTNMGIGRYLVHPYAKEELNIDLTASVDSIKSGDRMEDLQSAIVNLVRDHVYRAWQASEMQVALETVYNGAVRRPEVIIATDPVIAEYLMITGDTRTLGNEFNYRVVTSVDWRMQNRLFITFGVFDDQTNVKPNPLHWGTMFWSPEAVARLPAATRGGAINAETIVQPRYLFANNLPVGMMLTFKPDTIKEIATHKVALYNKVQ